MCANVPVTTGETDLVFWFEQRSCDVTGVCHTPRTSINLQNYNWTKCWQVIRVIVTQRALVDVLIAGRAHISLGAVTEMISSDGVGVAVGAPLARVTDAGVLQLAEQTYGRI